MDKHRDSTGNDEHSDRHESHDGHHVNERNEDVSGGDRETSRVEQSILEEKAEDADEAEQGIHEQHEHDMDHGSDGHAHGDHGGHSGMHEGHEQMFRRRFFVSTLLSIPVLLYSETLQEWLGFSVPAFPGSEWINPVSR